MSIAQNYKVQNVEVGLLALKTFVSVQVLEDKIKTNSIVIVSDHVFDATIRTDRSKEHRHSVREKLLYRVTQ